jgi:hypothetical protein
MKATFLFFPILLVGCAINDIGLVSTRYFENTTSYLLIQEAWGGFLSTRANDGGLTFGHAERIMIYPKVATKSDANINQILHLSDINGFKQEIDTEHIDLDHIEPFAWIEKNQGLIFHTNKFKTGVLAGTDNRSTISLPANYNGVFIFNYQDGGTIQAYIQESQKFEGGKNK